MGIWSWFLQLGGSTRNIDEPMPRGACRGSRSARRLRAKTSQAFSASGVGCEISAVVEVLETRLTLSATTPQFPDGNLLSPHLSDEDRAFSSLTIDAQTYSETRVLVQFRDTASSFEIDRLFSRYAESVTEMSALQLHSVELREGVSVEEALGWFRSSYVVLNAEPDYQLRLDAAPIPNDSFWNDLWALNNTGQNSGTFDADIDAYEAWSTTTGDRRVVVAVIDSGIDYLHPDLAANIWVNLDEIAGNGIDDDGNGYVDDIHGYDFANDDGDPMDDNGHGTHVAGTIGAIGNNGRGVIGVSYNVQLMALKFLNAQGTGFVSNAVKAIDYAVANGAMISNNSWSGGGFSTSLFQAITRAKEAGHVFIAAAGNNGLNAETSPAYPAAFGIDNVLSVAATDHNDQMASFSNYGIHSVDLGAPGVSIVSTYHGNRYAIGSGTSMAAPHVTGVAALVWSLHPDWNYEQVIEQIVGTVDPLESLTGVTATGGRLNAANAVGAAVFANDDHGGDRNSATALTINRELQGRIETLGDQDWFKINVRVGDVIQFSTRAVTLDDVIFRLYGSSANAIQEFTTSSGFAGNLEWTADRNGTVYVQISSTDNLGSYRLLAETPNFPPVLNDVEFTVAENSPTGTLIGQLSAVDPNAGDTFTYKIIGGNQNNAVLIESDTGKLRVQNASLFDYESQSSFQITVEVKDAKGMKAQAKVTIQIADVNETPRLDNARYYLMERTSVGAKLLQMQGVDPDAGQTLSYSLVSHPSSAAASAHFSIDSQTGWLTLNSPVANLISSQSVVDLTVRVTDPHGLSATATISILPAVSWQGDTVTIDGTDAADDFLIRFMDGDLLVTRNGITDLVDLNGQRVGVVLEAGAGNDKLTINGTSTDESAVLRGQSVNWIGPQVQLQGNNLEEIKLIGGGGRDRAELFDSAGDDNYVGTPTSALFVGTGFNFQVLDFSHVFTTSEAGNDRARFLDTAGDETFVGLDRRGVLTGNNIYNAASGFQRVQFYATSGGNDRAKLFDSPGQDLLTYSPDYVSMIGPGYSFYLKGVPRVDTWSNLGGNDQVRIFDTAAYDVFVSTADYVGIVNATSAYYARGFGYAEMTSSAGGNDRVKLYDSAGNDLFTASATGAARWQGATFDVRLSGITQVNLYATSGGYDRVLVDGMRGTDRIVGRNSYATINADNVSMRFEGFDYLGVTAADGMQPIYDVSAVDYVFETFGTWINRASRASRVA